MKRRPLNSATLAITTHKELIRVSNGTSAQVGVWMINKCKVQMIGNAYIICKSLPREGDEKKGENTVAWGGVLLH